ncbi:MAG: NAD-dependent malic enzyme [Halieaceae bacterium]|nr:NAD-dependent malic enzyme [Halieaceae bacterium]
MADSAPTERGVKLLHDPVRNKGTAFTEAERELLGLRGLLPPRHNSVAEQELRVLDNLDHKVSDLERYLFLIALQDRNETLFYRVITQHIERMMPLIYTPTVGKACQQFGHVYRRPRGLYISLDDRGRVAEVLRNWPHRDARIIVVTDGERILGLGDLGTYGMGIPIGKLSLYTACAGIAPTECLPITLDVGTNNEALLNDPLYTGLERKRMRGPEYDELIEEFMVAVHEVFPGVLVQLEDFGNANAFRLLKHYRDRYCLFDDDIQGTGAVAVAGLMAAMRITGGKLSDLKVLFLGAGQAAIGIADCLVNAMVREGCDEQQARAACWMIDSRGLLTADRPEIPAQKQPYAHPGEHTDELLAAVLALKPTAIIGCAGQPQTFTKPVVRAMCELNERPIVFALSNPTSKAECTAEQAYTWSEGRAIYASGSPFDPVKLGGQTLVPGQGNNAYIFPGVGLGALYCRASRVTDEMFLAAANCLAHLVDEDDLGSGRIYPALSRIREVSAAIAAAVAEEASRSGLAGIELPENLEQAIREHMYEPVYPHHA